MTVKPGPLNILVVGAGMYVRGSGADDFGTILPTLVQEQDEGRINEIHVAGTRPESAKTVRDKLEQLNARMETTAQVHTYPTGKRTDTRAFVQAIEAVPRPAAAIVSVPDHLHVAITEKVIAAGIHPLVVKPLTPTVAEARQLIEALDRHNIYGAVEFHKRFDEANLLMRQKVRDGELGDLIYAVVEFSQRRRIREIFGPWVSETNIFQYLGVHYADLIYFASGARPVRVMATGQKGALEDKVTYDAIQALVEWKTANTGRTFVSAILTNWIDPDTTSAMSDQKIALVGSSGRYRSDQKNRGVQLVTQDKGLEAVNPYFTRLYSGTEAGGRVRVHGYGPASIRCFLRDVEQLLAGSVSREELNMSRPSFREALVSTAVVEAVNLSLAQDSRWVSISQQLTVEG
jgi:predicted dehydrogenase